MLAIYMYMCDQGLILNIALKLEVFELGFGNETYSRVIVAPLT